MKEEKERCKSFKPSPCNPAICLYWYTLGGQPDYTTHFCGSMTHRSRICSSMGRNPQEQEEDSFE